ncbi:MAG: hypothetical protein L0207_01425 [Chlamydiae bacterium]|nr:hypothetical protein [Chlamydiota bacterium]
MKKIFFFFFFLPLFSFCGEIDDFDLLMGKQTDHWIHVRKKEDIESLEKFKKIYKKNREILSKETNRIKIPKVIHLIWLGPKSFPPESVENVRSWIAHHPDWKIKFWTDMEERPSPCTNMEKKLIHQFPFLFLEKLFFQSENYGEKSDILRYEILYQEGGLYVDHDASCLKSFDPFHQAFDFYCGLETPHAPFSGKNITSGNGVIGSRSFHPVIGRVIEIIANRWEQVRRKYPGKDRYSKTQKVMAGTYLALTQAVQEKIDQEENVDMVFPAAYFFAKKNLVPIYSKHFYADAWAEKEERDIEFERITHKAMNRIEQKGRMLRWIGGGAFSINLLAFVGLFIYLVKKRKKPQ